MRQSLRDIALFVAVYEERSFTAAAQREGATQSGVSQHIRKLEDRFGVSLFSRAAGSVTPTPAGNAYYRHCLEVLRASETAERALEGFQGGLDGDIVVGLMPTMTRCTLAPALARFAEAHPNVVVRVVEAYSAPLTQMVSAGELSFAIVPAFSGAVGLKSRLFLRTPEVLVSSRQSGLRHLVPQRLADLGPLRVVVPSVQNTRRRILDTYFTSNGIQVERLLELDAMMGTLDFVARTDWLTILPGLMMASDIEAGDARQFTITPIAAPHLDLDLILIEPARQPLTPAAEAFLGMLEDEARRLNRHLIEMAAPVQRPVSRSTASPASRR